MYVDTAFLLWEADMSPCIITTTSTFSVDYYKMAMAVDYYKMADLTTILYYGITRKDVRKLLYFLCYYCISTVPCVP